MPKGTGIPIPEAVPMLADALAYYDETDVWRWFERHKRMTGHYPAVWPATLKDVRTFKKVPNEPFRKPWEDLRRPMILGEPVNVVGHTGDHDGEPEWCGLFRDELLRVRGLPEALDFRPEKIGPGDLSCAGISDFLRSALGFKESTDSKGKISIAWLVQYEVAEVMCKMLGLTPHQVGI